jgi:hypothetical protein
MFAKRGSNSGIISALFYIFAFSLCLFAQNAQKLIAVFDLRSDGTISLPAIQRICDKLSTEIATDRGYLVFERKYLPFVLEPLQKGQTAPCTTAQCLSGLGKQIGATHIIAGSIMQKNGKITIKLECIDVEKALNVNSISKTIAITKEDFISKQVPALAQDIMNDEPTIKSAALASEKNEPTVQSVATTPEKSEKKSFFNGPIIGGISAIALGGIGVAAYLYTKKTPKKTEDGDLPLGNVPEHKE